MTIPLNSINKQEAETETETKINTLKKENERLRDYNTQLKLDLIEIKKTINEILTILNK
tara:strand:+ start:269 stop:445 length:177 start_codon:yes stop_codon:yes gene_type:complete